MARVIGEKMKNHKSATSFNEILQKHKYEYLYETGKTLTTIKELAIWAIATGRWEPPRDLAIRKCREDYARALREEYIKDSDGQPVRVNQAARKKVDERQTTFWGDIRSIPRSHMESASTQRREQIVGECRQLDRDERFFNEHHPDEKPLQTYFDFTDDVQEGRFSGILE
jgi:hypothetical protein